MNLFNGHIYYLIDKNKVQTVTSMNPCFREKDRKCVWGILLMYLIVWESRELQNLSFEANLNNVSLVFQGEVIASLVNKASSVY